jgi:hypothetical protein
MKNLAITVQAVLLMTVCILAGTPQHAQAQAFGMISAAVEKADDMRGLTVRSEPSQSASVVGYLPVGTEIKSCNDFRDGWVKLEIPSKGNWVNMAFLKPKGGEGTVAVVDKPESCLAIRKGPHVTYEKTGCATLGQRLKLSGVWSNTNWARLEDGGWVDASKIQTDLFVCSTPMLATAEPEPQAPEPVEPPVTDPGPAPVPYVGSAYPECLPYGSVCPPLVVGGLPPPIFLGDFGAFGYFPGIYPYLSIGIGSYGRYFGHFLPGPYYRHGRGPYYGHHRGPGTERGDRRPFRALSTPSGRANMANLGTRNATASVNRSIENASRALGSNTSRRSLSRASSDSVFRGAPGSGFRSSNFSRGRAMNMPSFSSRASRGGGFSGASFRGGGNMRGGGMRGGGGRR